MHTVWRSSAPPGSANSGTFPFGGACSRGEHTHNHHYDKRDAQGLAVTPHPDGHQTRLMDSLQRATGRCEKTHALLLVLLVLLGCDIDAVLAVRGAERGLQPLVLAGQLADHRLLADAGVDLHANSI